MPVLIDIGNSTIKLAHAHGERFDRLLSIPTAGVSERRRELISRLPQDEKTIAISSVVPSALRTVEEALRSETAADVLVAERDFRIPIETSLQERSRIGTDRLLEALGAWRLVHRSLVAVAFGTAITFDCVDSGGVFLGGLIFPGAGLCAGALAEGTAALPSVEILPTPPALGRNTEEAIARGVFRGIVAAVSGILDDLAVVMNDRPAVLATGAAAHLFAPHVSRIEKVDEFLLFRGLAASIAGP